MKPTQLALRDLERSLRAAADRAAAAAVARRDEERLCVVCHEQPRTHAPAECLHLCCCELCCAQAPVSGQCPICRSALPPAAWRRVFLN